MAERAGGRVKGSTTAVCATVRRVEKTLELSPLTTSQDPRDASRCAWGVGPAGSFLFFKQNLELSFVRSYIKKREKNNHIIQVRTHKLLDCKELLKTTISLFYIFRKGGNSPPK
jgi:hypothetical protein